MPVCGCQYKVYRGKQKYMYKRKKKRTILNVTECISIRFWGGEEKYLHICLLSKSWYSPLLPLLEIHDMLSFLMFWDTHWEREVCLTLFTPVVLKFIWNNYQCPIEDNILYDTLWTKRAKLGGPLVYLQLSSWIYRNRPSKLSPFSNHQQKEQNETHFPHLKCTVSSASSVTQKVVSGACPWVKSLISLADEWVSASWYICVHVSTSVFVCMSMCMCSQVDLCAWVCAYVHKWVCVYENMHVFTSGCTDKVTRHTLAKSWHSLDHSCSYKGVFDLLVLNPLGTSCTAVLFHSLYLESLGIILGSLLHRENWSLGKFMLLGEHEVTRKYGFESLTKI